jgi:hypothetical protein
MVAALQMSLFLQCDRKAPRHAHPKDDPTSLAVQAYGVVVFSPAVAELAD